MNIIVHVFWSIIALAILYPIYGNIAFFVLVTGVLIDIDHYFWHIFRFKDFSIINAYNYHKRSHGDTSHFHIFHMIEVLFVLFVFSFVSQLIFVLFIGLLLHYILDFIHGRTWGKNMQARPWSYIRWFVKTLR